MCFGESDGVGGSLEHEIRPQSHSLPVLSLGPISTGQLRGARSSDPPKGSQGRCPAIGIRDMVGLCSGVSCNAGGRGSTENAAKSWPQ